jgi:hypothetical protein
MALCPGGGLGGAVGRGGTDHANGEPDEAEEERQLGDVDQGGGERGIQGLFPGDLDVGVGEECFALPVGAEHDEGDDGLDVDGADDGLVVAMVEDEGGEEEDQERQEAQGLLAAGGHEFIHGASGSLGLSTLHRGNVHPKGKTSTD